MFCGLLLPRALLIDSSQRCYITKPLFHTVPGQAFTFTFVRVLLRSKCRQTQGKSFPILRADIQRREAVYKMHEGWVTSSVQFPNHQPERLPGFDVLTLGIILKMRKKEKTLGRKKKKNIPIKPLCRIPVVLFRSGQIGRAHV